MINKINRKDLPKPQDLSRGIRMDSQNKGNDSKKNNNEESEFLKRFRQMLESNGEQNIDKKLTK